MKITDKKKIPAAQAVSLPIFIHIKLPFVLKTQPSGPLTGQSQPTKPQVCAALEELSETEGAPPCLSPPDSEPFLAEAHAWALQKCFSASVPTVTEKS